MAKQEQLREQLTNGLDIQSVVKTMKSFAAVNMHQNRKASDAMIEYCSVVENGLAELIALSPPDQFPTSGSSGIILFGSDQGLVGSFNERIASTLNTHLAETNTTPLRLAVLGKKLARILTAADHHPELTFPMPSSSHGISGALQNVISTADLWYRCGITEIFLVNAALAGPLSQKSSVLRVLPPDPVWIEQMIRRGKEITSPSCVPVDHEKIMKALVDHYILTEVHRALIDSMLCENTLRLAAMQVAEKHIEEFLEELTLASNQERQNSITEELLDIEAGVAAME